MRDRIFVIKDKLSDQVKKNTNPPNHIVVISSDLLRDQNLMIPTTKRKDGDVRTMMQPDGNLQWLQWWSCHNI